MVFKKGQVALSFVLLVGGIIIEIVIAGSFITYFLSSSGLSQRIESRASSAAYSGILDAMGKISKNRDFVTSGVDTYSIVIGNDSSIVTVSRNLNSAANSNI